ncbi:MAG: Lrp/AsnC family transcriptional regulator [Spirochaetes bacterium]|nr:Lrp/AsnC family transcriptional regulator [Spirochaetota bacterium]
MDIGPGQQRLLEEIQRDFPLETRPFAALGRDIGLEEHTVIGQIENFLERGIIREISAILDGSRIGYKSTLVAVRAPVERITQLADRISSHPGVSHNYQREHPYNLWFTLSIPKEREFDREIDRLLDYEEAIHYMILPALKTFKLRVHLRLTKDMNVGGGTDEELIAIDGNAEDSRAKNMLRHIEDSVTSDKQSEKLSAVDDPDLDGLDRKVISVLQRGFPLEPRPWLSMARNLGIDEAELLDRVRALKSKGVIRRVAGVLRHRKAGFNANGMVCFAVPEERIDEAGRRAAQFPQVSHCYHRSSPPEWPYPLFAMVHARSKEECERSAAEIADQISCSKYSILYSTREFKKERVKYFIER